MRTEFGRRLYEARKRAKKTQVQLCKAVGMSQGNYTDLETNGQSSGFTPKIAAFLGVNVNWLAYGEGDMIASAQPEASHPTDEGERFVYWLNKIADRDLRVRARDAAMQLVYAAGDGQWSPARPTPEHDQETQTAPAARPARAK